MGATPRGDLPRNEGGRNYPYGPLTRGHARPSILAVRFHAMKTQDDVDTSRPLFDAIMVAGQARMAGLVFPASRDRRQAGKARRRARKMRGQQIVGAWVDEAQRLPEVSA